MPLKIRWLGHAGFRISFQDTENIERVIYIDAWLENPKIPEDFKKVPEDADFVLVTHGHFDHASSAPAILKASKKDTAKIITPGEVAKHYISDCDIPESKTEKLGKGGTLDFGFCKISMVPADHSSSCITKDGHIHTGGAPVGFIVSIAPLDATIYHFGDTNIFMDMSLIEETFHPNILLLPIGDRFTMGPEGAALSVTKFFKSAKYIVPMHFDTFPLLTGTYEEFKEKLGDKKEMLVNTYEMLEKDWQI